VHGTGVLNEIEACPGVAREELCWEQVTFEAITAAARGDEITRRMDAALRERKNVIDGGDFEVERSGAIHAAPAAITHHGVFNSALLVAAWSAFGAFGTPGGSRKTGETDVVIVSTPRQFHLAEKATPHGGSRSRSGALR